MSEQGGGPEVESQSGGLQQYIEGERYARDRGGFDVNPYTVAATLLDSKVDADYGRDWVAMFVLSKTSPDGGGDLPGYPLSTVLDALSTRCEGNRWFKDQKSKITEASANLFNKLDLNNGSVDVDLVSAIEKQLHYKRVNEDHSSRFAPDLTDEEMDKYDDYKEKLKQIQKKCDSMGDLGRSLWESVDSRSKAMELDVFFESGLLPDELKNKISDEITSQKQREKASLREVSMRVRKLDRTEALKEIADWGDLTFALLGISQVMNCTDEWLKNQYDLDPIGKVWEYQSRMSEMHPSKLKAMAELFPSFNDAFRGISAISSGKMALGSNGEIYPSGRYGLGYIDNTTGRIVDVDDAVDRDRDGKIVGVKIGVTRLESDEIWVNGAVKKVVDGKCNIAGEDVEINSKNILYEGKLKDSDTSDFVKNMIPFVRGRDKVSPDYHIDLGVEMAREFFEMSMLSNWYGAARDSKGRPYYASYKITGFKYNGAADYDKDLSTISSNPESKVVKTGMLAVGWDEGSLFPSKVNDWGKLTFTKAKQAGELFKARKHGIYALIPWMPENMVKPLLDQGKIDGLIGGTENMVNIFGNMTSNAKLKDYWLNIAKGVAVYEFISSNFIGGKEPAKVAEELIGLLSNPRELEGLNKNIDLSVSYADPWEGARLKVNIITAALATVGSEFFKEEFLGIAPRNAADVGRISTFFSQISEDSLKGSTTTDLFKRALAQLVTSRFVGDKEYVFKIIQRLDNAYKGKTEIGFTMNEFKNIFGSDYLSKVWEQREERKVKVLDRGIKKY